jgi:hypothetical protein
MDTYGIVHSPDPFIPKLHYDKAVMPVKRIDAFQIGDLGRRAALFDPYKPMRHCRSHYQGDYRATGAGRTRFPIPEPA